ncbi:MAG: hypothetical protein ACYTG7_19080 [Planctomycetota bacterium]
MTYLENRALDFTDIIDFKVGYSYGLAGVKVEVTDYAGTGIGLCYTHRGIEWFGRSYYNNDEKFFLHLLILGFDDAAFDNAEEKGATVNYFGYNHRWYRPELINRFRIGGEIIVPLIHFGTYLNIGELYDFLVGIACFDPANDDGLSKFTNVRWYKYTYIEEYKNEVINECIDNLYNANEQTKLDSIDRLVKFKSIKAIKHLIVVLEKDESDIVRENAGKALNSITGEDYGQNADKWKNWYKENINQNSNVTQ